MENKQAEVDGFQLSLDLREQLLQTFGRDRDLSILTPLLHKLPVLKDAYVDVDLKLKILHFAAWAGDVDLVRKLKNVEADPTAKTEGGYTALHLAASGGHCPVITELQSWLGRSISVQEDSSEDGFTSLHLAACSGHAEAVTLLLEKYEDVENAVKAKDKLFGRNVLHFAIAGGHADVVRVLFDSKVPLDLVSKDRARGWTPFLLSAWQRPLFHATMKRFNINIMDKLLEVSSRQINEQVGGLAIEFVYPELYIQEVKSLASTALTEAVNAIRMSKFFKTHKSLLLQNSKYGTLDGSVKRISVKDNEVFENQWDKYQKFKVPMDGHAALHLAATQNNHELVKYLIQREGIQLNVGERLFGMTPLHCTIRTGAMEAFKVLISLKDVDVNAKVVTGGKCHLPSWLSQNSTSSEKKGRELDFAKKFQRFDTPLHLATRMCKASDLLEMLVEFGSHPNFDPATYNYRREVPLHIVWERWKAVQDSVNTFLVAATFIAGVTFAAYLQPPFGTEASESEHLRQQGLGTCRQTVSS
ncbi:hypothetical protein MPTK1_7g19150 [Marchantia polymorpha subsp. ruderalis]|uniref:PGG domain-containing protein n=2 Tax=Marchantia polymorpha TaxID=3197 RepID=A0AAF6C1C0_MARPO|nr:hypothetical protein MARPO_0067s0063 [Marchantia polymorpha]BBN18054.1 hypothetical protein Mp_7g19150 [Marchantia polymorpha subsp. ruderalis]|eukprot:PTQ35983.1 hypothetical protein MARPO_0067s0063 [Marchantia polymorpha]